MATASQAHQRPLRTDLGDPSLPPVPRSSGLLHWDWVGQWGGASPYGFSTVACIPHSFLKIHEAAQGGKEKTRGTNGLAGGRMGARAGIACLPRAPPNM
ncbi:MAG: hypothetical protein J2P37_10725 [Ktedonobacteraceae bacterium]|nr:hypothetical protein [Ktedonobacteraceae bacterium]